MKQTPDVLVIGGGPAGMMAAATAAELGESVCLLERNERTGRKLIITGKGRCNLTNNCSVQELMENVTANGRFLYSAFSRFTPRDVMEYFEALGVKLKTERGKRVFPVSDDAREINDALDRRLKRLGVSVLRGRVGELVVENGLVVGVRNEGGLIRAGRVVLATGGMSYPLTGSDGDGYALARAVGHTIIPPKPSIVPLEIEQSFCAEMQGLSLRNVSIKVLNKKNKKLYEDFGELLFTHFGVSGPLIFSASAHMRDFENDAYHILIDLKPALDEEKLDARLLRDFSQSLNRSFENSLGGLFPSSLAPVMARLSGVAPGAKVNSVTREQRREFVRLIKALRLDVSRPRPIEESIVTSGGVKTSEINPSTMASRLVPNLYFAGEIIDVDAYTGGFNLQIAWSTGRAAGHSNK